MRLATKENELLSSTYWIKALIPCTTISAVELVASKPSVATESSGESVLGKIPTEVLVKGCGKSSTESSSENCNGSAAENANR